MPLVRRTRATLRSAEFGFFGVVVLTRVQTARRWGEPFSAGVLVFSTLSSRPLRTSWLIVGMGGLDLLPALGRALECVALLVVPGVPVLLEDFPPPAATYRPAPAVGRVALPGTGPMSDRTRLPLATPRRHPPAGAGGRSPVTEKATQAHREREQAQGTLGTAAHSTRALKTGQNRVPCARTQCCVRRPERRHPDQRGNLGFSSRSAHATSSRCTVGRHHAGPIACVAVPTVAPLHPG